MPLQAAYIVAHPPLAIPEIGRGQEKAIAATIDAYHQVAERIVHRAPDTIIFISPHSAYYADWIYIASGNLTGDLSEFRTPGLRFSLPRDHHLSELIIKYAQQSKVPAGPVERHPRKLDHGVMVPLYFIEQAREELAPRWRYQGVSIGGSALPRKQLVEFGRSIVRAILRQDLNVVLVVSGDLSHKLKEDGPYGYDPAGPVFDEQFADIINSGDLMRLVTIDPKLAADSAECGLSGCIMLAGVLDELAECEGTVLTPSLLSLEGPFGVGYGIVACEETEASHESEH